jgi:hypothetical protein
LEVRPFSSLRCPTGSFATMSDQPANRNSLASARCTDEGPLTKDFSMDVSGLFSNPDRHEVTHTLSQEPVKSPTFSDNDASDPDLRSS